MKKGSIIFVLPMPDKSRKVYRDYGKGAFERIISLWKMECRLMRSGICAE